MGTEADGIPSRYKREQAALKTLRRMSSGAAQHNLRRTSGAGPGTVAPAADQPHRSPPAVEAKADAREKAELLLQQRFNQPTAHEAMHFLFKKDRSERVDDMNVPIQVLQLEQQKSEQYRTKAESLAETVTTLQNELRQLNGAHRENERVIQSLKKSEAALQFTATKSAHRVIELTDSLQRHEAVVSTASLEGLQEDIVQLKRENATAIAAKIKAQHDTQALQKEKESLSQQVDFLKFQIRDHSKSLSDALRHGAKLEEQLRRKENQQSSLEQRTENMVAQLKRLEELRPKWESSVRRQERMRVSVTYEAALMGFEDVLKADATSSGLQHLRDENRRLAAAVADLQERLQYLEDDLQQKGTELTERVQQRRQDLDRLRMVQAVIGETEADYEKKLETLRMNLRNSEEAEIGLQKALSTSQAEVAEVRAVLKKQRDQAKLDRKCTTCTNQLSPQDTGATMAELRDQLSDCEAKLAMMRRKTDWSSSLHHRLLDLAASLVGQAEVRHPKSVHDVKATLELDCFALDILIHSVRYPEASNLPNPLSVLALMQSFRGTPEEEAELMCLVNDNDPQPPDKHVRVVSPEGEKAGQAVLQVTAVPLAAELPNSAPSSDSLHHCRSSIPAPHARLQGMPRFVAVPISRDDSTLSVKRDSSAGERPQSNPASLRLARSFSRTKRGMRFRVLRDKRRTSLTVEKELLTLPGIAESEWVPGLKRRGRSEWGYLPVPPTGAAMMPSRFPKLFDAMNEMNAQAAP